MFPISRFVSLSAALSFTALSAFGQNVISAKSGLVHYIEGAVSVDGKTVSDKTGTFAEIKKDGDLTTTMGRAEVLLTPGVFFRVGEQSAVKMRNTSLEDTRVEMLSGEAILESDIPMKGDNVTVLYKDYEVQAVKHGLFGFTTNPPQFKVYSGEATVTAGGQTVAVREGHLLNFTAALAQERFDPKDGDSLYRWSKLRSEYISVANVSAAKSAQGNSFTGGAYPGGNWYFNPYYSMYTFLPLTGTAYSPFGFAFWSPFTVNQAYYYPAYYGGNPTSNNAPVKSTPVSSNSSASSNNYPLTGSASNAITPGFGSNSGSMGRGIGAPGGHGK
jgi:hypothetical protein